MYQQTVSSSPGYERFRGQPTTQWSIWNVSRYPALPDPSFKTTEVLFIALISSFDSRMVDAEHNFSHDANIGSSQEDSRWSNLDHASSTAALHSPVNGLSVGELGT